MALELSTGYTVQLDGLEPAPVYHLAVPLPDGTEASVLLWWAESLEAWFYDLEQGGKTVRAGRICHGLPLGYGVLPKGTDWYVVPLLPEGQAGYGDVGSKLWLAVLSRSDWQSWYVGSDEWPEGWSV